MSQEQQEVVAVFKDGSGFSVKEVNWKARRWRLEARKATTGGEIRLQPTQVTLGRKGMEK